MIIGIGVDLCSIVRMEKAVRSEHFIKRVFSAAEAEYANSKARPAASFAAAFAAREAFCKASGIPMYDVAFGGVSLEHHDDGRPFLNISEKIEKVMSKIHANIRVFVSVSHEGDFAVANVVLETAADK